MSASLWDAAVRLAEVHSVYDVAQALRLDYGSLRNHKEDAGIKRALPGHIQSREGDRQGISRASFIELPPAITTGEPSRADIVVEMIRPDGAKMTIRQPADTGPDITILAAEFWRWCVSSGRAGQRSAI
jgi:hypothetical protein